MPKQLNTLGTLVLLTAIVGLVSKDPVTRVPKIGYIDVVSMCCMSGCRAGLVPVPGCCDWLGPGLAARGRVNEGGGRGQESRTAAELGRGLGTDTDTAILITRSRDGESFHLSRKSGHLTSPQPH